MLDHANKVPRGEAIRADVCIVGAGGAGITIARELANTKHSVVLLESGAIEFDQATEDLYQGTVSGLPYDLTKSRLRFFGGSTNHWAGQSRPLDRADFESRDWVPNSGWPFARTALDRYYPKAHKMCDLGPFRYDAQFWTERNPKVQPLLETDTVRTDIFQIGPGTLFGTKYKKDVVRPRNIRVILEANVVNVRIDGARAAGVDVKTLGGNDFTVDAPVIVIASGGIENARILLASRTQRPAGLGNDHDLVGRYFMDHSLLIVGKLILSDRAPDPALYFFEGLPFTDCGFGAGPGFLRARHVLGMLALTPSAAKAARIPAWSAQLFPPPSTPAPSPVPEDDIRSLIGDVEGRSGKARAPKEVTYYGGEKRRATDTFELRVGMEPTPSPDSRVTLTADVDPLGVPRLDLRWAYNETDWDSIERGVEVLGREIGRLGLGRIQRGDARTAYREWGNHHMGTTRMHRDPTLGVVDQHQQVHGIEGLYVAGSSVFPTVGFTNPTLNIVALSLRLADRLKKVLR
jgi:choline dehydrogenase-like flavoprotein